jgi:hypothetical protein
MHGVNNIKKGFEEWGVLFAIYKLVVFENRVMRIMFELKAEEMGGKGGIIRSFIIYTACQVVGYQRAVE